MAQCTGNCFKCDLVPEQDKMACCSIQTLRNVIEVKAPFEAGSGRQAFSKSFWHTNL